jgi:hypothetical protein
MPMERPPTTSETRSEWKSFATANMKGAYCLGRARFCETRNSWLLTPRLVRCSPLQVLEARWNSARLPTPDVMRWISSNEPFRPREDRSNYAVVLMLSRPRSNVSLNNLRSLLIAASVKILRRWLSHTIYGSTVCHVRTVIQRKTSLGGHSLTLFETLARGSPVTLRSNPALALGLPASPSAGEAHPSWAEEVSVSSSVCRSERKA